MITYCRYVRSRVIGQTDMLQHVLQRADPGAQQQPFSMVSVIDKERADSHHICKDVRCCSAICCQSSACFTTLKGIPAHNPCTIEDAGHFRLVRLEKLPDDSMLGCVKLTCAFPGAVSPARRDRKETMLADSGTGSFPCLCYALMTPIASRTDTVKVAAEREDVCRAMWHARYCLTLYKRCSVCTTLYSLS